MILPHLILEVANVHGGKKRCFKNYKKIWHILITKVSALSFNHSNMI